MSYHYETVVVNTTGKTMQLLVEDKPLVLRYSEAQWKAMREAAQKSKEKEQAQLK